LCIATYDPLAAASAAGLESLRHHMVPALTRGFRRVVPAFQRACVAGAVIVYPPAVVDAVVVVLVISGISGFSLAVFG
jgi:hypothetical protein